MRDPKEGTKADLREDAKMSKGGRSHYSGPGKGSQKADTSKSKMQLPHTAKQAGHGKANRNPGTGNMGQIGKPAQASMVVPAQPPAQATRIYRMR